MTIDLQLVIATIIVYLGYCAILAGGIQLAVNQMKPLFLDAIKAWLVKTDETTAENRYLVVIYALRTVITALAYFYLWGGVMATRAALSGLASTVPDVGIAVVTIAVVVLGEEIIHPLIERFYILRDIARQLGEIDVTVPVPATSDTTKYTSTFVKTPPAA